MADDVNVVITGIGMRTAAGNHAVQTCATVRAGVSCLAEWPHYGASFDEEGTALIAGATRPDLGDAAWIEKAEPLATLPVNEALWNAGLLATAPDGSRLQRSDAAAILSVPPADRPGTDADAHRAFALDAREHCIAPVHAAHVDIVARDQAGGIAALAQAVRMLSERRAAVVVVGGIDSLLSTPFLATLADDGRLRLPDSPAGVIPGEAAGFVVLEREEDARRRGARTLARVGPIVLDVENPAPGPGDPIRAEALSRAVRGAVDAVGGAARIGRTVSDLNGERWRFQEWALVETRCLAALPDEWQLWHPADCIGDVGAAYAPVAIGIAVRAFARGYAGDGAILICASSPGGERAAACILPPG